GIADLGVPRSAPAPSAGRCGPLAAQVHLARVIAAVLSRAVHPREYDDGLPADALSDRIALQLRQSAARNRGDRVRVADPRAVALRRCTVARSMAAAQVVGPAAADRRIP